MYRIVWALRLVLHSCESCRKVCLEARCRPVWVIRAFVPPLPLKFLAIEGSARRNNQTPMTNLPCRMLTPEPSIHNTRVLKMLFTPTQGRWKVSLEHPMRTLWEVSYQRRMTCRSISWRSGEIAHRDRTPPDLHSLTTCQNIQPPKQTASSD